MDEDELLEMMIRAWALHCATNNDAAHGSETVLKRAKKFEAYIRGEQGH